MRDLTVGKLQEIVRGRLRMSAHAPLRGEQSPVANIVTDSRQVHRADVFWALGGTRFDGASFTEEAYARGASGVVAGKYIHPARNAWSLQVDNAQGALERLARWARSRVMGRVVAVTGSVGKTTTRQMIRAVLETRHSGCTSPRNYNNHVGLPLAMLAAEPQHAFVLLEAAASAPGEIAHLAALCRPHIGVITRIGDAHLGGFGSREAVAEAKTELLDALPADGWAVLNGDDDRLRRLGARSPAKVVWFGRSAECDLVATGVHYRDGRLSFRLGGKLMCVPVWGRHYLPNALAAVAVGRIFGLSDDDIARGLAQFEAPPMRCQVTRVGEATIIDDTYNASPVAMQAALELLRDFDAPGRRIVVCGDMRELGDEAADLHRRLGDQVVTLCGADLLVACGEYAGDVVAGARAAGMSAGAAVACRDAEEIWMQRALVLRPGDVVLVKGSRALGMERLVYAFEARQARRAPRVSSVK